MTPETMPTDDLVASCAARLSTAAQLASTAARGPEPLCGAEYLLDTVRDLAPGLRELRARLRRRRPNR